MIVVWSHEHRGCESQYEGQTLVPDAGTAIHMEIPLICAATDLNVAKVKLVFKVKASYY